MGYYFFPLYLHHPEAGDEREGEGDDDEEVGDQGDQTHEEAVLLGSVLLQLTMWGTREEKRASEPVSCAKKLLTRWHFTYCHMGTRV